MFSRARRAAKRRGLRGGLRVLASLALFVIVLLPAAFGGVNFVWCAPLGRVQSECCCRAARAAQLRELGESHCGGSKVDSGCCEGHRIDSMPPSLGAHGPDVSVPPCPLVALLPPELARQRTASNDPCAHFAGHPPRAGPTASLFALHCRYLI